MLPLHTHTHTIACSGCFMVDSRVMFQSFSFLDFLRITWFIRSRTQHFETCQSFLKLGLGSYLLNHRDTSWRPLLRPVLSPHKSDHHLTEMLDYHQVVYNQLEKRTEKFINTKQENMVLQNQDSKIPKSTITTLQPTRSGRKWPMLNTFPKSGPQKAYELRRTPDLRINKYNMC